MSGIERARTPVGLSSAFHSMTLILRGGVFYGAPSYIFPYPAVRVISLHPVYSLRCREVII